MMMTENTITATSRLSHLEICESRLSIVRPRHICTKGPPRMDVRQVTREYAFVLKCYPHYAGGHQYNASEKEKRFDPRQNPIGTHIAPQSLDCPE